MILLILENGVLRGVYLFVQLGFDVYIGLGDEGGIEYQEIVLGIIEKCLSQVSIQFSGQSFYCIVFCKIQKNLEFKLKMIYYLIGIRLNESCKK